MALPLLRRQVSCGPAMALPLLSLQIRYRHVLTWGENVAVLNFIKYRRFRQSATDLQPHRRAWFMCWLRICYLTAELGFVLATDSLPHKGIC